MALMRGLSPTPRWQLSQAPSAHPRLKSVVPPQNFATVCTDYDMAGNDRYGDCVSAEECNAKKAWSVANGLPEIEIAGDTVIAWAKAHNALNGAVIADVLTQMQTDGLKDVAGVLHYDGGHQAVNWTNPQQLMAAIFTDKTVKLGVAADQLQPAVESHHGKSGWFLLNARPDPNTDHCTGAHGYGTAQFLADAISAKHGNVVMPAGLDPNTFCVLMYTWQTVGIVPWADLQAIMLQGEAWVRDPGDVSNAPPPPDPNPNPPPGQKPITLAQLLADLKTYTGQYDHQHVFHGGGDAFAKGLAQYFATIYGP